MTRPSRPMTTARRGTEVGERVRQAPAAAAGGAPGATHEVHRLLVGRPRCEGVAWLAPGQYRGWRARNTTWPRPARSAEGIRRAIAGKITQVPGADEYLPDDPTSLAELRRAAADCQGCDLYRNATRTVFGEGRGSADLILVGEQPGDMEDREGAPFVGPAGKLLTRALEHAGIERAAIYLTNAVKHFKWEPRGGRRLHKKPNAAEVRACRPWLQAEIAAVAPRVVCCLGSTAAASLLGSGFRVTQHRQEVLEVAGEHFVVVVTVHPSSILRAPPEERELSFDAFVADLAFIARFLQS
jgi:uracil-DNA glycosylase family protein